MPSSVHSRRVLPRLRNSESLSSIVSQAGPLPEEQVWSVIDQLLARLESMHDNGTCHRCISLSTIGIDAAGELEIATTDASLSISDLVRLHAPLPTALRHEFELVIPSSANDSATALAHAGFGGDGVALDLFQVAVLTVRMVFDVDSEKFLSSPCLQETLSPPLCQMLRRLLAVDKSVTSPGRAFRELLPGAVIAPAELTTPVPQAPTDVSPSTFTATAVDIPVAKESDSQPSTSVSESKEPHNFTTNKELAPPDPMASEILSVPKEAATHTAGNDLPSILKSRTWVTGIVFLTLAVAAALVVVWVLSR